MKAHCHIPSFWLIKNLVKRFEVFLIVTIVTENVVDGIKSHRHFSWNLDGSPKCSLEMIHACFLNKSKKQNWKINELISVSGSILPRNRLNVNSKIILKFDRVVTYFLEREWIYSSISSVTSYLFVSLFLTHVRGPLVRHLIHKCKYTKQWVKIHHRHHVWNC